MNKTYRVRCPDCGCLAIRTHLIKPKLGLQNSIELDVAREEARATCATKGATSPECAAAWDEVEELQAAAADKRQAKKKISSLEAYCAENPDAKECRIYED